MTKTEYKELVAKLPELTGSPKQVKWARTIRSQVLKGYGLNMPEHVTIYVLTVSSAKTWIDGRNCWDI